jgi:hypothetical protein
MKFGQEVAAAPEMVAVLEKGNTAIATFWLELESEIPSD